MKILVISSHSRSLINFRGQLLKSFVKLGHDVIAVGPDFNHEVKDELSEHGIMYMDYHLERTGTNIFSDFNAYQSLKKLIREVKPDLMLSYTIKPIIYGSLAAKKCKVPKVYAMITGLGSAFDSNSSMKARALSKVTEILYRKALSGISGVIFQNPDDRQVFINKGLVDATKSYRIYGSGVDIEHFKKQKRTTDPVRFLFIGRLIKDKGIYEFIEAAKKVHSNNQEAEFHIVGWADNNPSSVPAETINQWKNLPFITYHGKVDDVRPYIKEASVFVLPSYREGTPRTALEAMAMGRPIIVTDAPGCRETVKEGVNGYLVQVHDSNILAERMEKFIQEPHLISKMGNESRKLAEEVYDVHKVNQHILQILGL